MTTPVQTWVDVGALSDIPVRGARVVKTAAGCIAVFRTAENEAHALEDLCPHKGGPLSQGIVHGTSVTCPFVVVSDVVRHNDTTPFAHVLLPSLAWGEKDGTVTNSERRISRQRAFLAPPGEARADWWQMAEVGKRMGFAEAFSFGRTSDIFAEYAQLSGIENNGTRDFDISRYSDITQPGYDAMLPVQWPQPAGTDAVSTRFFGDGRYFTPDRRARFVATPYRALSRSATPEFPFVLNTGRIRDQWHTMTRTAKTARLMSHISEPFVEIHPDDAQRLCLKDAELAEIRNDHGQCIVRTLITSRQRSGSVFVPMHWTDQYASAARIGALIDANVDPISGQPELKAAPVSIRPFAAAWYGFAVGRTRPESIPADYWAAAPSKSGWRVELAGRAAPPDWDGYVHDYFKIAGASTGEVLAYRDERGGQHRFAIFDGDQLIGALFIAPSPVTASRTFAADKLGGFF